MLDTRLSWQLHHLLTPFRLTFSRRQQLLQLPCFPLINRWLPRTVTLLSVREKLDISIKKEIRKMRINA
jgi:hypothetical protein